MKPQPLRPSPTTDPEREPTPEEALRDVVAEVATDARTKPAEYLKQTRVPAGGE